MTLGLYSTLPNLGFSKKLENRGRTMMATIVYKISCRGKGRQGHPILNSIHITAIKPQPPFFTKFCIVVRGIARFSSDPSSHQSWVYLSIE